MEWLMSNGDGTYEHMGVEANVGSSADLPNPEKTVTENIGDLFNNSVNLGKVSVPNAVSIGNKTNVINNLKFLNSLIPSNKAQKPIVATIVNSGVAFVIGYTYTALSSEPTFCRFICIDIDTNSIVSVRNYNGNWTLTKIDGTAM